MFASKQYRVKAAEYAELVKKSTSPIERREFQELEKSLSVLAYPTMARKGRGGLYSRSALVLLWASRLWQLTRLCAMV